MPPAVFFFWRQGLLQRGGLCRDLVFLLNANNPALGEPHDDGVASVLRLPAHLTAGFDDVFNHVGAEHARALGNNHLAVRVFVELDSDFYTAFCTTLCPTVLEIVETDNLTAFHGKSHMLMLDLKQETPN